MCFFGSVQISFSLECGAGDGQSQTGLHGDVRPGNRGEGDRGVRLGRSEVATSQELEVEVVVESVPVQSLRTALAGRDLRASCSDQSSVEGEGVGAAATAAGTPWELPRGDRVLLEGPWRSGAGEPGGEGEGPPGKRGSWGNGVLCWDGVPSGGAWQWRERGKGDEVVGSAIETASYLDAGLSRAVSAQVAVGQALQAAPLGLERAAPCDKRSRALWFHIGQRERESGV